MRFGADSPRGASGLGLLLVTALLAGCGREESRVYRIPKQRPESTVAAASPHADPHASHTHPVREQIRWQLPKGWEELPAGEMRVGDFRINATNGARAEVSIIPLPGQAGADLANVNRWRGQVGLAPVSEEQLTSVSEPVEVAGQTARLYDMAGLSAEDEKTRILAVIFRRGDTSWFFKAIGDDALVLLAKPTFQEFLKTLSFAGGAESKPAASAGASATPNNPKPNWTVPAGWQEQPPGQMQNAKFTLAGNAEVTVADFPGDVGGLLANVNRWRGQMGLAPVDEAELPRQITALELSGGPGTLVDITTENKQRRLVAVIVPRGNQTWFYKLAGEAAAVAAARDAYVQFVKSAH